MQPVSVTQSSSGSSPWKLTNWHGTTPMQVGFSVAVSGFSSTANGTYQIDVALFDPSSTFTSSVQTVWQASQVGGPATSSLAQIGSISTCPIAAWRLTLNSSTGSATATALQVGIG